MALPTILPMALVASSICLISCRFVISHNEASDGFVTELSHRGKIAHRQFHCPTTYGRYPHPYKCEYFFECRFSRPTLMHCNRGYLYDREREQCRDWRRVKCRIGGGGRHDHDHREHKNKDKEVKEDMRDFKCPYTWGTFAHPYDCSKYFVCVYNFPKLFQCHNNFLYHDEYRKCLPRNRVQCGNRLDRDQLRTSKTPASLTTTIKPLEITTTKIPVTTENEFPPGKTTISKVFSTLTPGTVKNLPDSTIISSKAPTITAPITTASSSTTRITTPTTIVTTTVSIPTTTRKVQVPTSTTSSPIPTISTSSPIPTSTTTSPIPTSTTTSPVPITTSAFTTSTLIVRETSTSTTSIPIPTITTTASPEATVYTTFEDSTAVPVTKPNTPPSTNCDEDDLDCIIDDTGDVVGWFECPKRFGHFPHGSSAQLFIHCDNWRPFIKKCAENTFFSPKYLVCVWVDKSKGI